MRDLGIPGYKGGKKPKHHRIVPAPPKDYRVADPDVLKQRARQARAGRARRQPAGKKA
jgi:hypothetical protein